MDDNPKVSAPDDTSELSEELGCEEFSRAFFPNPFIPSSAFPNLPERPPPSSSSLTGTPLSSHYSHPNRRIVSTSTSAPPSSSPTRFDPYDLFLPFRGETSPDDYRAFTPEREEEVTVGRVIDFRTSTPIADSPKSMNMEEMSSIHSSSGLEEDQMMTDSLGSTDSGPRHSTTIYAPSTSTPSLSTILSSSRSALEEGSTGSEISHSISSDSFGITPPSDLPSSTQTILEGESIDNPSSTSIGLNEENCLAGLSSFDHPEDKSMDVDLTDKDVDLNKESPTIDPTEADSPDTSPLLLDLSNFDTNAQGQETAQANQVCSQTDAANTETETLMEGEPEGENPMATSWSSMKMEELSSTRSSLSVEVDQLRTAWPGSINNGSFNSIYSQMDEILAAKNETEPSVSKEYGEESPYVNIDCGESAKKKGENDEGEEKPKEPEQS